MRSASKWRVSKSASSLKVEEMNKGKVKVLDPTVSQYLISFSGEFFLLHARGIICSFCATYNLHFDAIYSSFVFRIPEGLEL